MVALREAMRESTERQRALCTPHLLGVLRRVLLLPRNVVHVDAAAALVSSAIQIRQLRPRLGSTHASRRRRWSCRTREICYFDTGIVVVSLF
jgi:hypothetical protein